MTNSYRRHVTLRFLALTLALTCFVSGFSTSRASTPRVGGPCASVVLQTATTAISWKLSIGMNRCSMHQQHQQRRRPHPLCQKRALSTTTTTRLSPEETIEQFSANDSDSDSSPSTTKTNNTIEETDKSRQNRRIQIALGLIASIITLAGVASTGMLGTPYTSSMIIRDVGATTLTAVLAVVLVKLITFGYEKGWYDSKIGRKLNHTLAAPLFILFFPAFSEAEGARFFAGLVTMSNIFRLYLAGTGQGESTLAQTISRSGDKSEVLGGPFIYVCIFQLFIWFFWRSSMIGVIAMSTMAAGDGMADIIGRKFGQDNKWSFSDGKKSKVGTFAFAISAFVSSFGLVNWLIATGCLETTLTTNDLALRILLISFACAIVELFPSLDDNYSVPGVAAVLAAILLH